MSATLFLKQSRFPLCNQRHSRSRFLSPITKSSGERNMCSRRRRIGPGGRTLGRAQAARWCPRFPHRECHLLRRNAPTQVNTPNPGRESGYNDRWAPAALPTARYGWLRYRPGDFSIGGEPPARWRLARPNESRPVMACCCCWPGRQPTPGRSRPGISPSGHLHRNPGWNPAGQQLRNFGNSGTTIRQLYSGGNRARIHGTGVKRNACPRSHI